MHAARYSYAQVIPWPKEDKNVNMIPSDMFRTAVEGGFIGTKLPRPGGEFRAGQFGAETHLWLRGSEVRETSPCRDIILVKGRSIFLLYT